MRGAYDRFSSFVASERDRHARRALIAAVIAALVAVLLYQTQWTVLRPGLAILLAGQAGVALALMLRNIRLSRDLSLGNASTPSEAPSPSWFDREESFVTGLAFFESACQLIGFITLGYALWIATRSLWLALAIGLIYPATAYFAMTRKNHLGAVRRLRSGKNELELAGQTHPHHTAP